MKEVLKTIILNLVENKEEVEIQEEVDGKSIILKIKVSQNDMGRVIGKQGRIAKALRTLTKALATKEQKRVTLEFVD